MRRIKRNRLSQIIQRPSSVSIRQIHASSRLKAAAQAHLPVLLPASASFVTVNTAKTSLGLTKALHAIGDPGFTPARDSR